MAKKKIYYIPVIEVIDLMGGNPLMALPPSKGYWPQNGAPKHRWTDVF